MNFNDICRKIKDKFRKFVLYQILKRWKRLTFLAQT